MLIKEEILVREYDINKDILVVEKSKYKNGIISGPLFLVPIEEWINDERFHLYETKLEGKAVSLYLACGEYAVIHKDEHINNRTKYVII